MATEVCHVHLPQLWLGLHEPQLIQETQSRILALPLAGNWSFCSQELGHGEGRALIISEILCVLEVEVSILPMHGT